MDEANLPPPVQPIVQVGVKLSDLNAVKQQIVARAGIMLTAIGLLATSSGTIGQLIPNLGDTASRPSPVLVYIAAFILPFSAYFAVLALNLWVDLQDALVARLKITDGHQDVVSAELQNLFVQDIENSLKYVEWAKTGLLWGAAFLLFHAYLGVTFHLQFERNKLLEPPTKLLGLDIPDFPVLYYVSAFAFVVIFGGFKLLSYIRTRQASRHRQRIKALEREARGLLQANEILPKASAYVPMAKLERRSNS